MCLRAFKGGTLLDKKKLVKVEGKLTLQSCDEHDAVTQKKSSLVDVPPALIDAAIRNIQKSPEIQEQIRAAAKHSKEVGKEAVYRVTYRSDLASGLNSNILFRAEDSLEIKDMKSKKIVAKAKLEEVDISNSATSSAKTATRLSNITQVISSLAGQMQMAEISAKIDKLDKNIKELQKDNFREKMSELKAIKETIEEDRLLLPDKYAKDRINSQIPKAKYLANYFKSKIEEIISECDKPGMCESIARNLLGSFMSWFQKDLPEYSKDYIDKLKILLGDYSFYLDAYMTSQTLVGSAYQIINGYDSAIDYYETACSTGENFEDMLYKKLCYLCNVHQDEDSFSKHHVCREIPPLLENRRIPLDGELEKTVEQSKKSFNTPKSAQHQFEKMDTELTFELPYEILEYTEEELSK